MNSALYSDALDAFRRVIEGHGMTPPATIEPGRFHRFPGQDKGRSNRAGWCKIHTDGMGGVFGDMASGLSESWQAETTRQQSPADREAWRKRVTESQARAQAELDASQKEAQQRAARTWAASKQAASHPYLTTKAVQPHGVRDYRGALVIPLYIGGVLHSLQFIGATDKRFLKDGRTVGCYYPIGKPDGVLCIVEGFATGATIREATGYAVAVAFNAGNLEAVARAMRTKFPDLILIICADDDYLTGGNPGLTKATTAARAVSGLLALPVFDADRPAKATDFNDMASAYGLGAVKQAIAGVVDKGDAMTPAAQPNAGTGLAEPLPELPDVLPFDYDYLPDGLRAFVRDISERMQCPPDFAAVGAFVMMATIIGRKVGIRPMRRNDWTVIPNLWGAVVGNSGVMKSPTLSAALSPVKKLQAGAYEVFNIAMASYAEQAEITKLQKAVKKTEAKKTLTKDKTANVSGLLKPDEAEDAPILKRFITNNASYEALGELLMENANGLLVEADEIIGLLKQLDAGGQEVARSFYLTAADGDKSYTFDRILRGKGLHIPALCLSIIGGIQPGVLAEYVRQATGGGAGADGLLQRFGLMVYPDVSPDWCEVDRYPDSDARAAVNLLAERLDSMSHEDIGAEIDAFGGAPFLHFDEAAQGLFSEWRAELERRLRSGEEHPAIVSHLSKYRKLIPSLALINHLCDAQRGAVSQAALLRAIAFSEYLESHARRIYSYATRPDVDAAKTLLKRLSGGKLPLPFKTRDIYIKGWTGLETPQKAQAAIDLLIEYSQLTEREQDTGGRPTRVYVQNCGGAV